METSLKDSLERVRARLDADTTCFRLLDSEGVTIDVFGAVAVLSFYRLAEPHESERIAAALTALDGLETVYVKHRPKEARKLANDASAALAPSTPLAGLPIDQLLVREAGLKFEIRPSNGLSVGLYLDARDARRWVRGEARGRRVLNLFAYTCGFGVAAQAGGAARAVNVDASRKVLDWGEANLQHNGRAAQRYDFIAGDAFEWLSRFAKKGEQFELIVLDPPGFATTSQSRFSAARDYHQLVRAAAEVLAPKGLLLSMCNVEALSAEAFEAQLDRGLSTRKARLVTRFGASDVDFTQPSALKCVVHEVV